MNSALRIRLTLAAVLCGASQPVSSAQPNSGAQVAQVGNSFNLTLGDQFSYDDNLYRLPSGYDIAALGTRFSRQDHINSAFVQAATRLVGWRQELDASIQLNDNRFAANETLNNTSGQAKVLLDWLASPRLSGTAGVDFDRSLAGFKDTFFFAKDLVDTSDYLVSARMQLVNHLSLVGSFKEANTTHSAPQRQNDEIRTHSGNLGIEYLTSDLNSFGVNYHYTDATFPAPGTFNGEPFDRSYRDSIEQFVIKYMLTGKTQIDANAGYQHRRYPNSDFGSFSGTTWRASVKWEVTGQTQLSFTGWHELTAYLDAESDYFVSKGASASVIWSPRPKVQVSLASSYSDQDYISTSPSTIIFNSRHDRLKAQTAGLTYGPRSYCNLQVSYRYETRDSSRSTLIYTDRLAMAQIFLTL